MFSRLAGLLLFAATLHGQTGAVSGLVRNSWTKAPILRAIVTLSTTSNPPLDAVIYTDNNGAFAFTGVPPGDYYLCSEFHGYQRKCFGSDDQGQPNQSISVGAAQQQQVTFAMLPLGSVSGTVTDSDGDPVSRAEVAMLHPQYERGKLRWRIMNTAATNDRGQYQLSFVRPGKYKFMASHRNQPVVRSRPDVTNGEKLVEEMYATAFYPGSESFDAAETVTLNAGNDLKSIDFTLAPRPRALVSGKVIVPPGASGVVSINLSPVLPGFNSIRIGTIGIGVGPPDYQFSMPMVSAGTYRLTASLDRDDHVARASQLIEAGSNSENLAITLVEGTPLAGKLTIEGEVGKDNGPFQIHLTSGEDSAFGGGTPIADVKPDGSFEFKEVVPGIWDIGMEPRPAGSYIKSIMLGERDVLTQEMSLEPGERPPLTIVVDMNGATISGSVTDSRQSKPAGRTQVLLAPDGKNSNVFSFYLRTVSKANGEFSFKSVRPGRYKLYAFDHMTPFEFEEPEFFKTYSGKATPVEIQPGARLKQDLALIVRGTEGEN